MINDFDKEKRRFIKLAAYVTAGTIISSNPFLYAILRGFNPGDRIKEKLPFGMEYLFGEEPKMTGILPPGTNRFLLANDIRTPSRYVQKAYEVTTSLHRSITKVKRDIIVDHDDPRILANLDDNLLIIGGPVATELTKFFCGYKDVPLTKGNVKSIPIFNYSYPLPYAFYVGNENGYGYWNDEYRSVKRWHENDLEDDFRLYGIIDTRKKRIISPPINGMTLAGDMLMILRVPNPERENGIVTVIGGMHGYSLEHFFQSPHEHMELFVKKINPQGYKYFQAIIPFKIKKDRAMAIDLTNNNDWPIAIEPINPFDYLTCLKNSSND